MQIGRIRDYKCVSQLPKAKTVPYKNSSRKYGHRFRSLILQLQVNVHHRTD